MGQLDAEFIERLSQTLTVLLGIKCASTDAIPPIAEAYEARREQYNSSKMLNLLNGAVKAHDSTNTLCLTDVDIYAPGMNFVFGEAYCPGRFSIVSTRRLDPRFYGHPPDRELFFQRVVKTAIHELGHMWGLHHCPDPRCVMHFSNSIADTDYKSNRFCVKCGRLGYGKQLL